MLERLIKEFEALLIDSESEKDIETTYWAADNLMFEMEKYSDSMVTAHDRLNSFILNENKISGGVITTTYISQYLIKSTKLLEDTILITESTHGVVDDWQAKQGIREKQLIYN